MMTQQKLKGEKGNEEQKEKNMDFSIPLKNSIIYNEVL